MNDAEFKARCEREAIAAGMPADVARFCAAQIGKRPNVAVPDQRPGAHRASLTRAVAPAAGDTLTRICGLFRAPPQIIADLRASGVSLRTVTSMLTAATGTARAIGPAGVEHVRLLLLAKRKGNAL
jgi:hypothetical protein